MRFALLVMILFLASPVRAEPAPVTVAFGIGMVRSDPHDVVDDREESRSLGPTLQLEVAHRYRPGIAIGGHLGVQWSEGYSHNYDPNDFLEYFDRYLVVDIGFAAVITPRDRIWLAPWFGIQRTEQLSNSDGVRTPTMYGLGAGFRAGVDLVVIGTARLGVFVAAWRGYYLDQWFDEFMQDDRTYDGFAAGVSYRY